MSASCIIRLLLKYRRRVCFSSVPDVADVGGVRPRRPPSWPRVCFMCCVSTCRPFCFYSVSDVHQHGGAATGSYDLFPLRGSVVIHHGWQTETLSTMPLSGNVYSWKECTVPSVMCVWIAGQSSRQEFFLEKIPPVFLSSFFKPHPSAANESHFI